MAPPKPIDWCVCQMHCCANVTCSGMVLSVRVCIAVCVHIGLTVNLLILFWSVVGVVFVVVVVVLLSLYSLEDISKYKCQSNSKQSGSVWMCEFVSMCACVWKRDKDREIENSSEERNWNSSVNLLLLLSKHTWTHYNIQI